MIGPSGLDVVYDVVAALGLVQCWCGDPAGAGGAVVCCKICFDSVTSDAMSEFRFQPPRNLEASKVAFMMQSNEPGQSLEHNWKVSGVKSVHMIEGMLGFGISSYYFVDAIIIEASLG